MNKVYEDYNDQHVINTYVYIKTADPYAYADSAKTVKIKAVDLKDLFEKGIILIDDTLEYKAVSFGISATVGTLTYVKTDGTVATTAVLATLKSEEFAG